jgi:hypothetical protein
MNMQTTIVTIDHPAVVHTRTVVKTRVVVHTVTAPATPVAPTVTAPAPTAQATTPTPAAPVYSTSMQDVVEAADLAAGITGYDAPQCTGPFDVTATSEQYSCVLHEISSPYGTETLLGTVFPSGAINFN